MESNTRRYSASVVGLPKVAYTREIPNFFCRLLRRSGSRTIKIRSGRDIDDVDELGDSFGKHLKALTPDFNSSVNADARDVATRPRNARYDSKTNRISSEGDYRNRARSCLEPEG